MRTTTWLLGCCLLLAGCGRDERSRPGVVVPFAPSPSGATSFGDVPWPSDLYLENDGTIGEVPGLERVAKKSESIQAGLSALHGFGRSTGGLFFMDAKLDPESLPRDWQAATQKDASVLILDLESGTRYPALAKPLPSLGALAVIPVPGIVLPPGREHAIVLTRRVLAAGGEPLAPDPELRSLADVAANRRTTRAQQIYGEAYDALRAWSIEPDQVASLAVFRTADDVREMPVLREALRSLPEPELFSSPLLAKPYSVAIFTTNSKPDLDDWLGFPETDEQGKEWPGGDNPTGIAHDQIRAVGSGAFVAPSFISEKTHHFERDPSGNYQIADPSATIPVTVVVPKSPMPPAGYPVVINGHGLSNNRGSMLSVANELCRAGFAMIGIDDVKHGARAGIADVKNNFKGKYQGPDGIPDELPLAASFFAGFSDFVAVRDNFRQTVLDQTSLVRLIQSSKLDLSPLAAGASVPRLDPARIYWSGGSLGGIIGAMTLAVEPEISAGALQVPGAGFVQLVTTGSPKLATLVGTLAIPIFEIQGEETLDEFHPIATLLGAVTEPGDPAAYAPHVLSDPLLEGREPPDVLVTYAVHDELLPNLSTVALIRALGLDLASPSLVDLPGVASAESPVSGNREGHAAAAVQYSPAAHGLGYGRWEKREFYPDIPRDGDPRFPSLPKPFEFEMPIREHAAQLSEFFRTAAEGAATIRVTAPPRADFDGDGVLDAQDASPWDPEIQ